MALLTGTGLRIIKYCSMADFPFLKMAAVRHLGFLRVENINFRSATGMRHHAKFREDRSNRSGDMADFRLFKMADVRHLGFVLRVFGPPTKSICWSLSLCKIWKESVQ